MTEAQIKQALRENQPAEVCLARRYAQKAQHALKDGHEFTITFDEFKVLAAALRCQLSGIPFRKYVKGIPADGNHEVTFNSWTLDRLDNKKGYVTGNCLSVCHCVNQMKSVWEDPKQVLSMQLVSKVIYNVKKLTAPTAVTSTPVLKTLWGQASKPAEFSVNECAAFIDCSASVIYRAVNSGNLNARIGHTTRGQKKYFILCDHLFSWASVQWGVVFAEIKRKQFNELNA